MLRFLMGAGSALLLVTAGFFIWRGMAAQDTSPIPPPPPQTSEAQATDEPLVTRRALKAPPSADERTKEERRFDRADKDDNDRITLGELYEPRRRAFARLDTNRDGRLSFEEWAVRTSTKFGEADANRDGNLTRQEYASTAPRRRARPQAACICD